MLRVTLLTSAIFLAGCSGEIATTTTTTQKKSVVHKPTKPTPTARAPDPKLVAYKARMADFIQRSRAFASLLEAGASLKDLDAKLAEVTSAYGEIPEAPVGLRGTKDAARGLWQAYQKLRESIWSSMVTQAKLDAVEKDMTPEQKEQIANSRRETAAGRLTVLEECQKVLTRIEKKLAAS